MDRLGGPPTLPPSRRCRWLDHGTARPGAGAGCPSRAESARPFRFTTLGLMGTADVMVLLEGRRVRQTLICADISAITSVEIVLALTMAHLPSRQRRASSTLRRISDAYMHFSSIVTRVG